MNFKLTFNAKTLNHVTYLLLEVSEYLKGIIINDIDYCSLVAIVKSYYADNLQSLSKRLQEKLFSSLANAVFDYCKINRQIIFT